MEKKLERITMYKKRPDGTMASFTVEVCEDPKQYQGKRAYIPGDTRYWEMDQLDKAIAGSERVERAPLEVK